MQSGNCKTLIWEATTNSDTKFYFATALRVRDRIDVTRLHQVLNRQDVTRLQMADKSTAESLTGYRSGTIPPFGHDVPLTVYFDEQLIGLDTLRTGSGGYGYDLQINRTEVMRFCEATIDFSVHNLATSDTVVRQDDTVTLSTSKTAKAKPIETTKSTSDISGKRNAVKPVSESWRSKPLARRLRDVSGKDVYHIDQVKECLDEAGDDLLTLMFGGPDGEYSKTPVHNAAWRGTAEVLDLFLEAGKKLGIDLINIKAIGDGNYGKTPIFYALTRSREAMVDHCLDLGADLLIVNNKGQTPCSLASSHLSEKLCQKMYRIEEEQLRSGRSFHNFRLSNSDSHKYGDLDPRFPIDNANMDDDIEEALKDFLRVAQQLPRVNGIPVGNGFARSLRKTNEEIRDALASERWGRTPRLKYLVPRHQHAQKPREKATATLPPPPVDVNNFDVLELKHVVEAPAEIVVVNCLESIQRLALAVNQSIAEFNDASREFNVMSGADMARHAWGLDSEWQPKGLSHDHERPVAILQLSSRKEAFVLDVMTICQQWTGDSRPPQTTASEQLLSDTLAMLFEASGIALVGFGIVHDLNRLAFSYPHMPCFRRFDSVIDFQTVARSILGATTKNRSSSLQLVVATMLKKRLDKTLQCSDWEARPLQESQICYGALDAAAPRHLLQEAFRRGELALDFFQRTHAHARQSVRMTNLIAPVEDGHDSAMHFRVEMGNEGTMLGVRLAKQVWPTGKEAPPLPYLVPKTETTPLTNRRRDRKQRDHRMRAKTIPLRSLCADLNKLPPVGTYIGYTKDSCAEAVLGDAFATSITPDFVLRFNRRGGIAEMSNCWLLFVNLSDHISTKDWKYHNQFSNQGREMNFSVTTVNGFKDNDLSFLYNAGCFDDSMEYVPKVKQEREIMLFARPRSNSKYISCGKCKIVGWSRDKIGYEVALEFIQYDELVAVAESPFCQMVADEERKDAESALSANAVY
jgi:prolyl-tRNA editing enzyme YbaK/EbsC (Cys-tRNA(Pro) deacylase)